MSRKRKRTGQAKKPISPFPLIGRSHYLHVAMVRIQLPLCFFWWNYQNAFFNDAESFHFNPKST